LITVDSFTGVRASRVGSVALVPTMGYFHEGHLSLISAAAEAADTTIVSLFVNPMQFGDPSDLDGYPRDEARDAALADKAGADVLFMPSVTEVYPSAATKVSVDDVAVGMEGLFRPGHFDGVATVVAKLFAGIQPDVAMFGNKDAQQLAVVRTMTNDLRLPVRVVGMPTVRELDGLALSSRNGAIAPSDRSKASALSEALFVAADTFDAGERRAAVLESVAASSLERYSGVEVEYVELADARTAQPVASVDAEAFLAVAATVGGVRLIDNISLNPAVGTAHRGTTLDRASILYEEGEG
jgi:pantoate--beta-alanine ligase